MSHHIAIPALPNPLALPLPSTLRFRSCKSTRVVLTDVTVTDDRGSPIDGLMAEQRPLV